MCMGFTIHALISQKAELRCLLPKHLLDRGFFPSLSSGSKKIDERASNKIPNYSWSGQRKIPSYVDKLVFPEEFLTSLRTIAMQENELFKVKSLLEEVHCYKNSFFLFIYCLIFFNHIDIVLLFDNSVDFMITNLFLLCYRSLHGDCDLSMFPVVKISRPLFL